MVIVVSTVVVILVVVMVFAVPVAFVHLPALLVVVVVGMAPVGAGVGWPLPDAGDPDVVVAASSPVAIDPDEALFRYGRPDLIADCRWRPDVDLDLAECRDC